jgi:FG-GAP-like repeat/Tetratricopeptide repeat
MANQTPRKSRTRPALVFSLILVVAAIAVWFLTNRKPGTTSDVPEAAIAANARGIGYLEQFDAKFPPDDLSGFEMGRREFQEALRLAPRWLPAKVNTGLSFMYVGTEADIERAIPIFREVLAAEPNNPHANFCLGIIHTHRGEYDLANPHFAKVTEADPLDAHAWHYRALTTTNSGDSPEAREYYEKAVKNDPYLANALLNLGGHILTDDPTRKKMLDESQALERNMAGRGTKIRPGWLGRYGAPIGAALPPPGLTPLPKFERVEPKVNLAANTKWTATVDADAKAMRERFGGTMVRLDFNGDGKIDLLLLSAVTRDGQLGDLLLRNDGGSFTDVSTEAGLAGNASLGCAVADFDNSDTPDLALTSTTGVKLLRNVGGKFSDLTKESGLDKAAGSFLPAAWVDLDQDGDLDLLLGKKYGGMLVFLNVGEAPPGPPGEAKPLSAKFQQFEHSAFTMAGPVQGFLLTDVDADGDVDIVALEDGRPPVVILNDRLLRFRRGSQIVDEGAGWTGATTIDINGDGQSDLVFTTLDLKAYAFATIDDRIGTDVNGRFEYLVGDLPILLQAQAIDLDHDGRTDLVGLSKGRKPVLLRGEGKLKSAAMPFGVLADLIAVAAGDFDGDCDNDVIGWGPGGLTMLRNAGNGNKGLKVKLTGVRQAQVARTNCDGLGAKATVLAGNRSTLIENTTRSAGLGQSLVPLDFGVGPNATADALRIAWPDMIPQAEVNLPTCEHRLIRETDRRPDSCPVLFTWDGEKYRYVTDLLGEGTMGELNATGGTRPPRPEESVKIEADQLKPKDGRYKLKLAEPMNEILYLDSLRLDAVNHPAGVEVYPDERFAAGAAPPTQKLLAFRSWYSPASARDHRGRDVTATLKDRDGKFVDAFARRLWLGLAEEHAVELDFGDRLEAAAKDANLYLVLAGWTDYAYPETLFAATQAGVTPLAPTLEKKVGDGPWQPVGEIGFPAGLPRTMTSPVTGLAGAKGLKLRIRTNMHVFWDQIRLGVAEPKEPTFHAMPVAKATLARRGFAKEVRPNGSGPAAYDDATLERVAFTKWRGRLTRLGDVTELLTATDDRFAILGPGDEVEVEFDATLPPPQTSTIRSFVLRAHGYCKDSAPFTATTGEIYPLPFRAMASYPDGARDRAKAPPGQNEYDRTWNTRPVGR